MTLKYCRNEVVGLYFRQMFAKLLDVYNFPNKESCVVLFLIIKNNCEKVRETFSEILLDGTLTINRVY